MQAQQRGEEKTHTRWLLVGGSGAASSGDWQLGVNCLFRQYSIIYRVAIFDGARVNINPRGL